MTEAEKAAKKLDGMTMKVPDLRVMLAEWPQGFSKHHLELETAMNTLINR